MPYALEMTIFFFLFFFSTFCYVIVHFLKGETNIIDADIYLLSED